MPIYRFKTGIDEYITVEAYDLDEALKKAGIDLCDDYEIIESDDLSLDDFEKTDFRKKCLFSAITDEILYGE